ncbi:MAG: hypothetical protein AAGF11_34235 [Myxococcota bacterium]
MSDRSPIIVVVADIEYFSSPGTSLVLDDRHFPVLIATWLGKASIEAAQALGDWVRRMAARAVQQDVGFVLVYDSTQLEAKPSAKLRAFMARDLDALDASACGDRFLGVLVRAEDKLLRSKVAMLTWLLTRRVRITTMNSMESALLQAKLMLESAGYVPPAQLEPSRYERPLLPDETLDDVSVG